MVYCFQEKLLFHPEKLPDDYKFQSTVKYAEWNIPGKSGNLINALFFKSDSTKGVIIYFHGNAGSLHTWLTVADQFMFDHYDVVIMDYPGYGKSKGELSEVNLFKDAQSVYDTIAKMYAQSQIIVYGRSIGTGIAAQVGSVNNPGMIILESPYYNMKELAHQWCPFLPGFILRYPFRTDEYIKEIKCPVVIFHGTADEVIPYSSGWKLKTFFKPGDIFITVKGGHHNDLNNFNDYREGLHRILVN